MCHQNTTFFFNQKSSIRQLAKHFLMVSQGVCEQQKASRSLTVRLCNMTAYQFVWTYLEAKAPIGSHGARTVGLSYSFLMTSCKSADRYFLEMTTGKRTRQTKNHWPQNSLCHSTLSPQEFSTFHLVGLPSTMSTPVRTIA
mgnify:CR=1 FL=1